MFLTDLLALNLPHRAAQDLVIDRIHWIPKPLHLSFQVPRDTIARIHFYLVKEEFLKVVRSQPVLLERFRNLSIYPDFSAATMLRKKEYSQYMKVLRESGILQIGNSWSNWLSSKITHKWCALILTRWKMPSWHGTYYLLKKSAQRDVSR